MAKARVTIAPEAMVDAVTIGAWWNRHRPTAPRLFQIELDRTLLLLAEQPDIGRRVQVRGRPTLRVLTLIRTRFLVFYEYRVDTGEVIVTRIRHGPP